MSGYQLTVRRGPRVEKDKRESLEAAIDLLEEPEWAAVLV